MDSQSQSSAGFARLKDFGGDYNRLSFLVQQALTKVQTATLVKVVKCSNTGGVLPVGYVDVIPMINQVDAQGNGTPHTTIFNVPYLRIQGGANAVIIDPEPGDIGICLFASRDISKVKNTRLPGNPGSARQFSFSDGLYLGGVLNGAPETFIQFSGGNVTITAPAVTINANVTVNGFIHASGDVTAGSISLEHHKHGGVQNGPNETGEPV